MPSLDPLLLLMFEVQYALAAGLPVKKGVERYFECYIDLEPRLWLWWQSQNQDPKTHVKGLSPLQRSALHVVERGLNGDSIMPILDDLIDDLYKTYTTKVEEELVKLPLRASIPVFLLMFPAYMALLLGPFLSVFLEF